MLKRAHFPNRPNFLISKHVSEDFSGFWLVFYRWRAIISGKKPSNGLDSDGKALDEHRTPCENHMLQGFPFLFEDRGYHV